MREPVISTTSVAAFAVLVPANNPLLSAISTPVQTFVLLNMTSPNEG
jgi:hypothetical protein